MTSRIGAIAFVLLATPAIAAGWSCDRLKRQIDATYGFRPSKLSDTQRNAKSKQMDAVWEAVQARPAELAPCLRVVLLQERADPWLLFDGAQLLASVDPAPYSKGILLDALTRVPLEDVDLRTWVHLAASLGLADLDTSALGKRWLDAPAAEYYLPEHAAYHVDREIGAFFIFGAMNEKFATPALLDLARGASGKQKEIAVTALISQATPEAVRGLATIDRAGLPPGVLENVDAVVHGPALIEARATPRTTRGEFLAAFNALLAGHEEPFDNLVTAVPDGERDLVAVVKDDDIPLLRRVRRSYAAKTSPHEIDYYNQFTQILMTLEDRRSHLFPH